MAGLGWTFEQLAQHLQAAPSPPANLNPLIEKLLKTCPGSSVLDIGGQSVVLYISENIAAKVALQAGCRRLVQEQQLFSLLAAADDKSTHVIRCLLQRPDVCFLEMFGGGYNLHRCLTVVSKPRPVLRWMLQLASAAASVEAIGYTHGDINPQNILVEEDDNLKLIDLDHGLEMGRDLDVGYEPYVRQFRAPAAGGCLGLLARGQG